MSQDDARSSSRSSNLPARASGSSSSSGGAVSRPLRGFFDESPFQMMRRMQSDMDRMFGGFWGDPFALMPRIADMASQQAQQQQTWQPSVDISEDDKEFRIEADLPGVKPEDVDVRVQNGYLVLSSSMSQETESGQPPAPQGQAAPQDQAGGMQYHRRERRSGYFQRTFALPENVDENAIRCDFDKGVLVAHLPKKATPQPQDASRKIPINAAASGQQAAAAQGKPDQTQQAQALSEEEAHEQDMTAGQQQQQPQQQQPGAAPMATSGSGA